MTRWVKGSHGQIVLTRPTLCPDCGSPLVRKKGNKEYHSPGCIGDCHNPACHLIEVHPHRITRESRLA